MLDRKQRRKIMKLFGDGMRVTKISKKVGVSTPTVYRVLQSVFKEWSRKAELYEKIRERERERELRIPLNTMDAVAAVNGRVDDLMSWVLGLWYMNPKLGESPPECLHCDGKLEFVEKRRGGVVVVECRCNKCGIVYPFP